MGDHTPESAECPWEDAFLDELSDLGNVREACKRVGIGRKTAYDRRENYPEFAARWTLALDESCDVLEKEARRRAVEGVETEIPTKSGETIVQTKYSDTLLIFLLKGARPEKYRENHSIAHSGQVGVTLTDLQSQAEADPPDDWCEEVGKA